MVGPPKTRNAARTRAFSKWWMRGIKHWWTREITGAVDPFITPKEMAISVYFLNNLARLCDYQKSNTDGVKWGTCSKQCVAHDPARCLRSKTMTLHLCPDSECDAGKKIFELGDKTLIIFCGILQLESDLNN